MGLDMYLEARDSVFNHEDKSGVRRRHIKRAFPAFQEFSGYMSVSVEVAYWRKANAIHKWFVEKVQGGIDDCREYEVSRTQLEDLLHTCKAIKENKDQAPLVLPTQAGFFFGPTNYDSYYFEDLDSTITQIEKVLALPQTTEFVYHSSW